MTYTTDQYAAAFAEWLRRFNADPAAFARAYGQPVEYGADCANYFTRLLAELFPAATRLQEEPTQ